MPRHDRRRCSRPACWPSQPPRAAVTTTTTTPVRRRRAGDGGAEPDDDGGQPDHDGWHRRRRRDDDVGRHGRLQGPGAAGDRRGHHADRHHDLRDGRRRFTARAGPVPGLDRRRQGVGRCPEQGGRRRLPQGRRQGVGLQDHARRLDQRHDRGLPHLVRHGRHDVAVRARPDRARHVQGQGGQGDWRARHRPAGDGDPAPVQRDHVPDQRPAGRLPLQRRRPQQHAVHRGVPVLPEAEPRPPRHLPGPEGPAVHDPVEHRRLACRREGGHGERR